jgi:1-acyl-sn-glycerol-3-phosphate acyltransferase
MNVSVLEGTRPLKSKIGSALSLLFLWFVKLTSAPFLFFFFKLKLVGWENRKKIEKKCIVIANHTSTWDPVLMNYIFPTRRIHFMTATELFEYNRLFTWFLGQLGAFSVNRKKADLGAIDSAIHLLCEQKILGIFPEGIRSLTGELLPFKPGVVIAALVTNTPIIPLFISGKYGFFRRMTVVVGEKIHLSDYCTEKHPPVQKITELATLLREKIEVLSEALA